MTIDLITTTAEMDNLVDDLIAEPLERMRAEALAAHPDLSDAVVDALIARDILPHARARTRDALTSGMLRLADDDTRAH
jgi:hypothetical protein